MQGRLSLRERLVILTLATVLPILALSIWLASRETRSRIELAQSQLLFSASLLATTMDLAVGGGQQLLDAVAAMPDMRAGRRSAAACQAYFASLNERLPMYSNLGLLNPDGQVFCHASGALGAASAADRAYFREALAQRRFVMGEQIVGRLSGRRAIPLALPLIEGGQITGVVFATLDLDRAAAALSAVQVPAGARVLIADTHGQVLIGYPLQPGRALPRPLVHEEMRDAASSRRSGVGERVDGTGEPLIYAFAPGRMVGDEGFIVRVSLARAAAVAADTSHLREALLVLALATLAAMGAAWWLGGRVIVKPAGRLVDTVRRLEHGDLDARVPLTSGRQRGEFARIGAAFNLMAESLQMRQKELENELGRSRSAYEVLDRVLNSMQEGLVAVTPVGRILMFNAAAARMFPLDGPPALPQQWPQLFGLYHLDRTTPYRADDLPLARAARGETGGPQQHYVRNALVPEGRLLQCSWQPIGSDPVQGGLVTFTDVTQLQRLQSEQGAQFAQLQDTQRKLVDAQRAGRIGNWELDLPAGRLWWSDQVFEVLGLDRASFSVTVDNFDALIHPDDRARHRAARDGTIARGGVLDVEYRIVKPDGEVVWVHDIAATRSDGAGNAVWIGGVVQDVSRRKRAEADLVLLRNAVARLNDILVISEYDLQGMLEPRIVFANEAFERLLGHSAHAAAGRTASELKLFGQHTDETTLARMRANIAEGRAARDELVYYTRDGQEIWLELDVVRMDGETEGKSYLISVLRDTTARKDTERALMQSEAELLEFTRLLQRMADAARRITADQSVEGTMQAVVDQARELTGAREVSLALTPAAGGPVLTATSRMPPEGARAAGAPSDAGVSQAVRGEQELTVPLMDSLGRQIGLLRLQEKDGGEFDQRDEYVAVELSQMAAIALDNARLIREVRDLNAGLEARIAERTVELGRQEQLYRTLAEQAPEVVWNTDAQGRATFLNHAWYDLVGGTPGEWLGYRWMARVHPDDLPEVQSNWIRSRDTLQPYAGTRRVLARDGRYHTMLYKAAPVTNDRGSVMFWVGIDTDITEFKAIESALRASNQELESFSYSVSHDLRAPLGAIAGFSHALAGKLEGQNDQRVQHYLARIQAGVHKMEQLIEALLLLAKVARAPLEFGAVDLSAMARETFEGLQLESPGRGAALRVQDGLIAHGDPRLLRLVMQNLLGNAWKFSSQREQAQIEVGRLADGGAFFVRDNGVGFDMIYAGKLFSAFHRLHTEAEFPGTGIGLATVRRIILRHQGRVWAESRLGEGTTFFFTLSQAPPPAWLAVPELPDGA